MVVYFQTLGDKKMQEKYNVLSMADVWTKQHLGYHI